MILLRALCSLHQLDFSERERAPGRVGRGDEPAFAGTAGRPGRRTAVESTRPPRWERHRRVARGPGAGPGWPRARRHRRNRPRRRSRRARTGRAGSRRRATAASKARTGQPGTGSARDHPMPVSGAGQGFLTRRATASRTPSLTRPRRGSSSVLAGRP